MILDSGILAIPSNEIAVINSTCGFLYIIQQKSSHISQSIKISYCIDSFAAVKLLHQSDSYPRYIRNTQSMVLML